jgi:hypothetical protein
VGKDLPRNRDDKKTDRCLISGGSIDTWIFHTSAIRGKLKEECFQQKRTNEKMESFDTDEIGAGNAALWALTDCVPFTSIYNACDRIHSWHFHLTPDLDTHKVQKSTWSWGVAKPSNPPFTSKEPKCIQDDNCFYGLEPQKASLATTVAEQQIDPQAMRATVSYVTNFDAKRTGDINHPHRLEIKAALLANILNPHFDQFVIFLDGISEEESCVHFLEGMRELSLQLGDVSVLRMFNNIQADSFSRVTCVGISGGQPSYYQMFQNAFHMKVTGDIVVLANADQVFDDTISLARNLNPEVLAVLGTRGFSETMPPTIKSIYDTLVNTDYVTDLEQRNGEWNTDMCRETLFSWDTYIFHKSKLMGRLNSENFKRLNTNNELVPFYMNEMGAENAALWAVKQSYPFTSIYNACDRIHSWHFHLTPKTHKDRETAWAHPSGNVPPPYFYDLVKTPGVDSTDSPEIPEQEVSLARLRRDEKLLYQASLRQEKLKRAEETLKTLDETEDIWLRRSPELHAMLKEEVSFKGILLVAF